MPKILVVTIPSADPDLAQQIEQGVEEYANVHQSKSITDPETVKLVLELVDQSVSIAGGVAGIITFIRSLKQEKEKQGQQVTIIIEVQGGPALPVEQSDPELLTRLLTTDVSE